MALELRDYQAVLEQEICAVWAKRPRARIMLQLPTGGGKTEIAAAIAKRYHEAGRNVTFVAHRQILIGQTKRRFADYGLPVVAGSGTGGVAGPSQWKPRTPKPNGLVLCGEITYRHRLEAGMVSTDGLLIIDEAHMTAGSADQQSRFANHKGPLLALTATPWRMKRHEGFADLCDVLFLGPSVAWLADKGYLAHYMAWNPASMNGPMRIPRQRVGESDERFAVRIWRRGSKEFKSSFTERAVDYYVGHPYRRPDSKGIVFAMSLDHAGRLQALFEQVGLRARVLSSNIKDKDRAAILSSFARPNSEDGCPCIINVGIIREGFDAPDADILLILRPTESLALHCQMIGRVMRPKTDGRPAQILDLAGNIERLEHLPDTPQDWCLGPRKIKKGGGEVPFIVCQGAVDLDDDGYISDDSGGYASDGSRLPRRNCFPTPGADPDGCGMILPIGRHTCECGLRFRKQCLAKPDGCGIYRGVASWHGDKREHRRGACDACCEVHERDNRIRRQLEERVALLIPALGKQVASVHEYCSLLLKFSNLRWTDEYDGKTARLFLKPYPPLATSEIIVERRGDVFKVMVAASDFDDAFARKSFHMRELQREVSSWHLPTNISRAGESRLYAVAALARWASQNPATARTALGEVCAVCRQGFVSKLPSHPDGDCAICHPCPCDGRRQLNVKYSEENQANYLMDMAGKAAKRGAVEEAVRFADMAWAAEGRDDIMHRFYAFDKWFARNRRGIE